MMKRFSFYLLLVLTVAGCGVQKVAIKNYEGPDRPSDQLVLLKPQLYITIHSIDGDTSKKFKTWQSFGSNDADIALAPGMHSFEVSFDDSTKHSVAVLPIRHEFQEGHRYLLGALLPGNGTWKPQIQDVTNRPELWCITAPRC